MTEEINQTKSITAEVKTQEKKSFFANLDPKSALIVGIVAGVLTICTIGFAITLFIALAGSTKSAGESELNSALDDQQAAVSVPKSDKPTVELFVMSYCPYGLQMEKAYLPVMELLKNKADLSIKFVSYAMHDLIEIEENTRQYCISTEQGDKFVPYLKCFTSKDDYKGCLLSAGVNQTKMNSCINTANKKYGILNKYNDQSTWLNGRYPVYPIHEELNKKYGVQGSPTLVINGVQAEASRSPESVKQVVCAAFNNQPAECQTKLDTSSPQAGFGVGTSDTANNAECGS